VIQQARITELSDAPETAGDYVLYWMQQSQREAFNPALEVAVVHANRLNLPVLVAFGLADGYPEANARHYTFMLEGLQDVQEALARRGIGCVIRRGSPDEVALDLARRAALVVCDRGYLRVQKSWRANLARWAGRRVVQVEGDVVVPVGQVSDHREAAAYTIRPKLLRLRDDYLQPLRRTPVRVRAEGLTLPASLDLDNVPALVRSLDVDPRIAPVERFRGGYREASQHLRDFVDGALRSYDEGRREPAQERVSFLSAYLHFGQISPVEVALAVGQADADAPSRAAYLEELIVRRELAMNFVEHEPRYDSYDGLPSWAQQTLEAHRRDPRPHRYDADELAQARTHDPYWNAAMLEMRETGYMHNHMRMYWGKKILEWSATPQDGFRAALTLNNRYFLCGRDANSFANIAWCFGLHDRPWPERPIFGKVRSMMASGLERKIDIRAYVRRVTETVGG
jgi:deoxyribodipyrimidine photo-lyase